MQEKEFVALVEKLEEYSRRRPDVYRLRVGLLAALGYLFLFAVVGLVVLLVAGVIYLGAINFLIIKFLIIPLGIAAVVVRSLWIEIPEPEGLELQYNDAPKLFDLAEEIRRATQGPRLHKILLTSEYNAGVVQRSRLGILGFQENYLVVGLPLLEALSPADVRAVLAHEFGHLSGSHGKFSGWIYRVRQTWIQVLTNMKEHRRYGTAFFETFFNWYAPYFSAYSFVLARAQEYEADTCSVNISGQQASARALIKLELKERALNEEFWPALFKRADQDAEPPRELFSAMLKSLHEPIANDKLRMWFVNSLLRSHAYNDTHPALADRLEAMGFNSIRTEGDITPFALDSEAVGSAEHFLTINPADFVASQDRLLRERIVQGWRDRNKFVREARTALGSLNEKAETHELSLDDKWERARLTASTESYSAAIPLFHEVLLTMPDHAAANYMLGEALLEAEDEAGIKHIEAAMEKDQTAIPAGCELIFYFLNARQRSDEAAKYRQCILDYHAEVELAQAERDNISKHDDFIEHSLTDEDLKQLQLALSKYPKLGQAYLVRKVVKHFPERPSYVLGVISKNSWYEMQSNVADQQLINQLASQVSFPGYTYIIALERNYKPLRKIFQRIDGSRIYQVKN